MSSFVIGLYIGRNHITASLIRIDDILKKNFTIERDLFHINLYENNMKKNPRLIVSCWIDCIEDLLHDFINYYEENDMIIGIACGISFPMDYERGICHLQSSKFNEYDKFYGLNLRLLIQSGLQDLSDRWKNNYYPRYYTPPTSPRPSVSCSKPQLTSEQIQNEIVTSTRTLLNFPIVPTINSEIPNSTLSTKKLIDYCGLQEKDNFYNETLNNDNEIIPRKISDRTNSFSSNLRPIIKQLSEIPISFYNHTTCFAVSEAYDLRNRHYERILVLTLGNNFGSTFIDGGEILSNRHDIPTNGILANCLYDKNSIANDCFSTRGLINIYQKNFQGQLNISNGYSLVQRALNGDENANKTFEIFANRLGEFLIPYIKSFQPNLLLIGGGLAQAWYLMENQLNLTLKKSCQIEIYFNLSTEKSICLGAAIQQRLSILYKPKNNLFRQTDQYLIPVTKTNSSNQYDLYPCHEIPIGYIGIGHRELNEKLFRLIKEDHIILIDGFLGTYFDEFAKQLNKYSYEKTNLSSLIFYDTQVFFDINQNIDFINLKQLNYLKTNLSYPCIIIGSGASFVNEISSLIYIDLPKNEFYYRNLNLNFDYSIFNKFKQELLPRINLFIDGQRPNCPTWLDGNTFRQALAHISNQSIRVRPCLKTKSSCSFEMNLSENGIILSDINYHLVEFSWQFFYNSQINRILGNDKHCRLFNQSKHFPIQIKIFDLINEENFEYTRKDLEDKITYDATYYIIKTKPNRKKEEGRKSSSYIYLGLQENIDSEELNIEKFIQCIPSHIHDFFPIPNQTIHAISQNQIVLEISTTPYMYDWLKLDVNDHLQSLTIKPFHCQPISIKCEKNLYELQHLPTHNFHIYDIERLIIEPNESLQIIRSTENRFHLCILVQGDRIEIEYNSIDNYQQKQIRYYNYIETFLIPASINEYRLRPIIKNKKSQQFILLIIFLKWGCDKLLK